MLNCFSLPGHFHEGADVLTQPTTLRRHLSGFCTGARPAYEAVEEHPGLPADDDLVLLLETTFPELLYEACWCLLVAAWPARKATPPRPATAAPALVRPRPRRRTRHPLTAASHRLQPFFLALLLV